MATSATALISPRPYQQQSNDQFNALKYLSTGAAFHEATGHGISKETPDQCVIDQAHLLMRHGERYPTASSGKKMQELLEKLKSSTTETVYNPLGFVHDYEFFVSNSSDYGKETYYGPYSGLADAFFFGSELRQRYNHLVDADHTLPVFTAGEKRVYDTAKAFSQGFFGNGYSGDFQLISIPEKEEQGANSLHNKDGCPNFDNDDNVDSALEDENLQYAQYEADRLNKLGGSGYNITVDDIFIMGDYCAYENNVREMVW
ncbi:unnamed protein product [Ambrosiozyma monospora]|uniref:Unnamed protein product n=1 Tax=Ambrosiozyma monospora TaxID=43982 RepID=A0ACB5TTX2_AMBMO|nr:unnamed protein product [Ambrosiozyma monospora]